MSLRAWPYIVWGDLSMVHYSGLSNYVKFIDFFLHLASLISAH